MSQDKQSTNGALGKPDHMTTYQLEEEIIDLGEMVAGEVVLQSVILKNTGDHDLFVKHIEADCDCVTIKLPERGIKPGEEGSLEIEFDSSGMIGKQLKTIAIHANSEELKHLAIFAHIENKQIEFTY